MIDNNDNDKPQNFEFDKFINDIVTRENRNRTEDMKPDDTTPQREYIKRYRELPQNKIRWE